MTRPNHRQLHLEDGTVVLGSNGGVWWLTHDFFSIPFEDAAQGSKLRTTARISFRGRQWQLRDTAASDLLGLGIDLRRDFLPGEHHAYVGFDTGRLRPLTLRLVKQAARSIPRTPRRERRYDSASA